METNSNKPSDARTQLIVACGVTISGVILMIAGFFAPPTGQIHSSVLVGFGECLTFSGSLLGIDYHYKR